MKMNKQAQKKLFLATLTIICVLVFSASHKVLAADEISGLSMTFSSTDYNPYVHFQFVDSDTNYTTLRFKVVVEYNSEVIDTRTSIYTSYTNGTEVDKDIRMYFGPSDVPGGRIVDYTAYAYNNTIATANLIDSASATKTVPNWDAVATAGQAGILSTIQSWVSNYWFILLAPIVFLLVVFVIYYFFRMITED